MIGTHRTAIYYRDGMTRVLYCETEVVSFDNNLIFLDHAGHLSATTKRRMNQTAEAFGLGFRVFQKNWDWYVDYQGEVIPYDTCRMVLHRDSTAVLANTFPA